MNKELLETRLIIVMRRDQYNFLSSLINYQIALKQYFSEDYTLDEIETTLHVIESNQLEEESKQQVIEYPEDFELKSNDQIKEKRKDTIRSNSRD